MRYNQSVSVISINLYRFPTLNLLTNRLCLPYSLPIETSSQNMEKESVLYKKNFRVNLVLVIVKF